MQDTSPHIPPYTVESCLQIAERFAYNGTRSSDSKFGHYTGDLDETNPHLADCPLGISTRACVCPAEGDDQRCAGNSLHVRAELPEASAGRVSRRIGRRRDQLEGPHLRLSPQRQRRGCSNSTKNGNFVKEIGKGYYGFEFAHSVRVDKDDNIWTVDEGTNMVTKFSPEGKVLMVLGRRPPAVDGRAAGHAGPEPAGAEVHLLPPDRCRLGSAGQHLRLRRLLQQPRREVRQERPLPRAGRQREGRQGARRIQPAARLAGRRPAATSGSPTAPTTATRCSTTI